MWHISNRRTAPLMQSEGSNIYFSHPWKGQVTFDLSIAIPVSGSINQHIESSKCYEAPLPYFSERTIHFPTNSRPIPDYLPCYYFPFAVISLCILQVSIVSTTHRLRGFLLATKVLVILAEIFSFLHREDEEAIALANDCGYQLTL